MLALPTKYHQPEQISRSREKNENETEREKERERIIREKYDIFWKRAPERRNRKNNKLKNVGREWLKVQFVD